MKKLILGSASPRRAEILSQFIKIHEIRIREVEENFPKDLALKKVAEHLACKKLKAQMKELLQDEVLVCADTVVLGDRIFGKPATQEEAKNMLDDLSNREHEVITGIAVASMGNMLSGMEISKVRFRKLSSAEIDGYIQVAQPFDKAGAYGIQDFEVLGLSSFIQKLEGRFDNVMGFSMQLFRQLLGEMGLRPWDFNKTV